MSKPYDYLVFIGRFQPFHFGHAAVITKALAEAKHVIVLIGSANSPRSTRNPFTYEERAQVIQKWAADNTNHNSDRVHTIAINDYTYNDQGWIAAVQTTVDSAVQILQKGWTDYPPKVGLIGHSKDSSSYYLGLFPQWGNVNVPPVTEDALFNSTDIRDLYFSSLTWEGSLSPIGPSIPSETVVLLRAFHLTDDWHWLFNEQQYINKYKEDHRYAKDLPYEATHTTVDAVVIQSGHVLVIERGAHPGKGQMCLPGGFIDPGETLKDGMLRELREETKIKVPRAVLAGNIKHQVVFDEPTRSSRGRVFSHTFLILLPPTAKGLPKLKAASDAKKGSARWIPLSELNSKDFFEDHYHIIRKMTGVL